jgi:hypothetical protein
MEGGVLTHALRLARGEPLLREPSVDFVQLFSTRRSYSGQSSCALSMIFGLFLRTRPGLVVLHPRVSRAPSSSSVGRRCVAFSASSASTVELAALATASRAPGRGGRDAWPFPFCGRLLRPSSGGEFAVVVFSFLQDLYSCTPGRSTSGHCVGALPSGSSRFFTPTGGPPHLSWWPPPAASVGSDPRALKRGLVCGFSCRGLRSATAAVPRQVST